MAEIPDLNPIKPIWPTRPDERGRGQPERDKEHPPGKQAPEHAPPERKPDPDDDHQIDEYV